MKSIKVLFEYEHKGVLYRGVRDSEGYHRMEKKGLKAKRFKAFMWTGNCETSLDQYKNRIMHPQVSRPMSDK